MKQKHAKDYLQNKNLQRFLESKIGQPWDKVYSELSNRADVRSSLGRTLRKRLEWTIDLHPNVNQGWPLLYVDPKTGSIDKVDRKKYKSPPKEIIKIKWYDNVFFEKKEFQRHPANCKCVSFRNLPPEYWDRKNKGYYVRESDYKYVCIHGNLPVIENIWFVVEYGYHTDKEVYRISEYDAFTIDEYGSHRPGDERIVHYGDVDVDRYYIKSSKVANHKELKELRNLLNN